MAKSYARHKALSDAYVALRHSAWAWLRAYGPCAKPVERRDKPVDDERSAAAPPVATDKAEDAADSFADIVVKARLAFLEKDVLHHLGEAGVAPPERPGSTTQAALLADLETVRLGALLTGNLREARAAVMDMAKLCMMAVTPDREAPLDDPPREILEQEAAEARASYERARDAITEDVRAARAREKGVEPEEGSALPPLRPAAPLP